MNDIRVLADSAAIANAAAEIVSAMAHKAIEQQGRFSLVLSGGSTPRTLYERQATEPYASQIQCVAGKGYTSFGKAQSPGLNDYADGVDTMQFLSAI